MLTWPTVWSSSVEVSVTNTMVDLSVSEKSPVEEYYWKKTEQETNPPIIIDILIYRLFIRFFCMNRILCNYIIVI